MPYKDTAWKIEKKEEQKLNCIAIKAISYLNWLECISITNNFSKKYSSYRMDFRQHNISFQYYFSKYFIYFNVLSPVGLVIYWADLMKKVFAWNYQAKTNEYLKRKQFSLRSIVEVNCTEMYCLHFCVTTSIKWRWRKIWIYF